MFLERMLRSFTLIAAPRDPLIAAWFGGMANTASGLSVTPDQSERFAVVSACVRIITESIASLPLVVYQRRADGGKEPDPTHYLYPILHDQPNDIQTSVEFWEMMIAHMLLRGNAYAQIISTRRNPVSALIPLHPDRMTPFRAPDGTCAYHYQPTTGAAFTFLQHEILHVRDITKDGLVGLSRVEQAREAIGLGMALEEFGARYFSNGTALGGVLTHPNKLSPEAYNRLKQSFEERQQGLANAHKPAILEEGMTWTALGVTAEQAQFILSRNLQKDEVAMIFRVPPHMIAQLSRCMPASTLVYTRTGPKSIAQVLPGEEVWSPTPTGPKLARVLNNWNNGIDEILEIRTTNRAVRCNAQHRLLVRRAHERPLNPGEVGGKNVAGEKKRVVWRDEYIAARDIKRGDTLVTLDRLPKEGMSTAPNGRKLTVGFMEFVGLLLADGNLNYAEGKPIGVQIARSASASYMDSYRATMREEFVSYERGYNYHALNIQLAPIAPVRLTEQERVTSFRSVLAAQELYELGFAGTAFTKRIPGWVFGLSEDLRLALLRGFLDGDGAVDKLGRIIFYSANKALIDDVRHLCMGCGVPVTNARYDDMSTFPPGSKRLTKTRMHRFTCSDPGANRRIGSHDTRYLARFAAGKPFDKKGRAYPRFGGKHSVVPGFALSRVCSVEQQAAEPVFDIEVEGTHCFIADGIASHNSTNNNIEQQSQEFVTYTLRPILVRIEKAIRRDLLTTTSQDTHFASFNAMALLRGDSAARSAYYKAGLGTTQQPGWLTPNDVRELEDMNPVANGDQLTPRITTLPTAKPQDAPMDAPVDAANPGDTSTRAGYRVTVPIEVTTPPRTVHRRIKPVYDTDGNMLHADIEETETTVSAH